MSGLLRLALPQLAPKWLSREAGVKQVVEVIKTAQKNDANLIVFSESFLPGYPFWLDGTGGAQFNNDRQKTIFAHYSDQAIIIEAGHLDSICRALKTANCLLYTSPSPRDLSTSRMPSSA